MTLIEQLAKGILKLASIEARLVDSNFVAYVWGSGDTWREDYWKQKAQKLIADL